MRDKTTLFVPLLCFALQFPGHGELLWGEAKVRGERGDPELCFHALVRVLQRLQEHLDTTKQEHLQGEVSWTLVGMFHS